MSHELDLRFSEVQVFITCLMDFIGIYCLREVHLLYWILASSTACLLYGL